MLTPDEDRFGFHQLKDICDVVSCLESRVKCILKDFGRFRQQTEDTIRQREGSGENLFRLGERPTNFGQQSREEIKLERSLARQWRVSQDEMHWFLTDACRGFQSYQVPTRAAQPKGWGAIDLIGVSESWLPQIWEVKRAASDDSPFHMILQALAYGLVVHKSWNSAKCELRTDWEKRLNVKSLATTLSGVGLFGLAPSKYWSTARSKWLKTKAAKDLFKELVSKCKVIHFPIKFVEFHAVVIKEKDYLPVGFGREVSVEQLTS